MLYLKKVQQVKHPQVKYVLMVGLPVSLNLMLPLIRFNIGYSFDN